MSTLVTKYNNPKFNPTHPFKVGVRSIIEQHFSPKIADRFDFILEIEKFKLDPKRTPGVIKQKNDQNFIMEVYYFHPQSGISTYVCDLGSWWSKQAVEYTLLRFITDKFKSGEIGKDWEMRKMSIDVASGKHETPKEVSVN